MKKLVDILHNWPMNIIHDSELSRELATSDNARYSAVKRALKNGFLVRLRKGLYFIPANIKGQLVDELALSLYLYEPSFVSLETALSFRGWIPEAVYTITSVSSRRAQKFTTPFGLFVYSRVPESAFYLGVERITSPGGTIFIAQPWRAIADFIYVYAKPWKSLTDLEQDMRIEGSQLKESDTRLLTELSLYYPSSRVRKTLKLFLKTLHEKN